MNGRLGDIRYELAQLRAELFHRHAEPRKTVAYARVSGHDQKEGLVREIALMGSFGAANG